MAGELHEAVATLPFAGQRILPLDCDVAAFTGLTPGGPLDRAVRVESFEQFVAEFGDPARTRTGAHLAGAKLAHAVRGFFRNGGRACWIARAAGVPGHATVGGHLDEGCGLRLLTDLDEPTIVAAPDAHGLIDEGDAAALVQHELVRDCERVLGRMALIDAPPNLDPEGALRWRTALHIDSPAAAAYYPWVEVPDPVTGATTTAPPSGHAAGLWARVDGRSGPHAAPTAEVVLANDGAITAVSASQQHVLNRAGVNCLRAWPGLELRAWGACTMSSDPELRYVHHERTVGHLVASIAQGMRDSAPNVDDASLGERLRAAVSAFLAESWRAGALHGEAPSRAFYVRCHDDQSGGENVGDDAHAIVLEIGLAVRRPGDFRVLRVTHRAPPA